MWWHQGGGDIQTLTPTSGSFYSYIVPSIKFLMLLFQRTYCGFLLLPFASFYLTPFVPLYQPFWILSDLFVSFFSVYFCQNPPQ